MKSLTKRTDFISNFVMIDNKPTWLNFDEGRVIMNGSSVYFTETHLKDHLGNTRVAIGRSNNALEVKQVNSFYPFGMNIKGLTTSYNMPVTKAYPPNEYLYNGNPDSYREFQDELGLDWLDYGARMYDAKLGRWHTQDRFSEKYFSLTNYGYAANNPVLLIDVNGDSVVYKSESTRQYVEQFTTSTIINKKGKEVKNKKYSSEFAQIISELDASSSVYEFDDSYSSSDSKEGGAVTTDGEKVFVGFSLPNEGYGSKSNSLFEETFHAHQVETGIMQIAKMGNSPTGYGFRGNGLEAEYNAKRFAAFAPGTSLNYTNSKGLRIETQIGLIKRLSSMEGKSYLTVGFSKLYPGFGSGSYNVDYSPPYPEYKK